MVKVNVTKYRFLQQRLTLELRELTPGRLLRSLENPSEPLSASTVWGMLRQSVLVLYPKHGHAGDGQILVTPRERSTKAKMQHPQMGWAPNLAK